MKSLPSNKEYARTGSHCPQCNGNRVDSEPVDIRRGEAHQVVACLVCGCQWEDLYELYGYRLIDLGDTAR